jgi:hypothetical protein
MRAVLHKDRVKVRIVRSDRKGRPEGRVVEIVERPPQPIIGRLLQEEWRLDRGARRQALWPGRFDPQGCDRHGQGRPGRGCRPGRTAGAVRPAGRAHQGGSGRDRRPGHGDRDRGAQVQRAACVLGRLHRAGPHLAGEGPAAGQETPRRPDRCCSGHDRWRRCARLRRRRLLRTRHHRARQDRDQGLAAAGGDRRREPLRGDRIGHRHRRLRSRHQRVFPAQGDSDAAGKTLQRPVFPEPGSGTPVHGLRHVRRPPAATSAPTSSTRR